MIRNKIFDNSQDKIHNNFDSDDLSSIMISGIQCSYSKTIRSFIIETLTVQHMFAFRITDQIDFFSLSK